MPTVPPAQAPFGGRESHQAREIAESFGSDPDRYDRARPRYPDALVDRIVAGLRGPDVLDVGCGTGIVARQFQAAGCRVLGIDPDARMADLARRHGFQPSPDVAGAFTAVYRRVLPDSPLFQAGAGTSGPDAYQGVCARAADAMREAGGFTQPEQWRFGWDRSCTRDEWLDQVPTSGFWAQIPAAGQRELLAGISAVIDAAGGSFTMHYTTVAVAAARTSTA